MIYLWRIAAAAARTSVKRLKRLSHKIDIRVVGLSAHLVAVAGEEAAGGHGHGGVQRGAEHDRAHDGLPSFYNG